jgi:hypothetical protein
MDQRIKFKVFDRILYKIDKGETYFDVLDCIRAIGLNPEDLVDVERVDEIVHWHALLVNQCVMFISEENN